MREPRYFLEKHTDHPTHCWRVVGPDGERHGFGLTEADAARVAEQLEAVHVV